MAQVQQEAVEIVGFSRGVLVLERMAILSAGFGFLSPLWMNSYLLLEYPNRRGLAVLVSTFLVVIAVWVLAGRRFRLPRTGSWSKLLLRFGIVGGLHAFAFFPLLITSDRLHDKSVGIGVNYGLDVALAEVSAEFWRLRILGIAGVVISVLLALMLVRDRRL